MKDSWKYDTFRMAYKMYISTNIYYVIKISANDGKLAVYTNNTETNNLCCLSESNITLKAAKLAVYKHLQKHPIEIQHLTWEQQKVFFGYTTVFFVLAYLLIQFLK